MERDILHISSYRESVVEKFSFMLRELGKRTKRPLWGNKFSPEDNAEALLYLDSGGRGNLGIMAKSMGADIIEYVFYDKDYDREYILLSEMLNKEYKDGVCFYKSEKESSYTLGKRIKELDSLNEKREFLVVCELPTEKSPIYSALKSEVKKNAVNGYFSEGELATLIGASEISGVIITDAFLCGGAFALLERRFGKPAVICVMNKNHRIYAPYTSLEKEIFIETEEFTKEALLAICCWLRDSGEVKAREKLFNAFISLSRGEALIERTINNFMKIKRRERRVLK